MDNKLPIKRLIICAAIAIVAVGLGYYNVIYSPYYNRIMHEVLQSVVAAAGITAIGEIFAALSKFPIVSYIISGVICSVSLQAMTPLYTVIPFADFSQPDKIFAGYQYSVRSCLAVYSTALIVSILFGIFVLHRKDFPKSDK